MIHIMDKSKCCGCTACETVCPKGCIKLTPDSEGFLYPKVNEDECIKCGKCEKVCPVSKKDLIIERMKSVLYSTGLIKIARKLKKHENISVK